MVNGSNHSLVQFLVSPNMEPLSRFDCNNNHCVRPPLYSPLHLDQSVGKVSVLHDDDVLLDPVVERRRQLAELLQLLLALGVEQRVTGWGLREHVVQLGHVRDDGLLVWFGGINICKSGMRHLGLCFGIGPGGTPRP